MSTTTPTKDKSTTTSTVDNISTTIPTPTIYSPASPTNPHVFIRVPYEKRLHWLLTWNPDNEPEHLDCSIAVDTVTYLSSHQTQGQQRYYLGSYSGLAQSKQNVQTCLHARTLLENDPVGAKKYLVEQMEQQEFEPEHVWRFRSVPLRFDTPQ